MADHDRQRAHPDRRRENRVDPLADTEERDGIATAAVQKILVEGDTSNLDHHLAGEDYVQHNHRFDNGVSGLVQALTALAEQGITMKYDGIRQVVADGDFAYIRFEGTFAGYPYVPHDLFHVDSGEVRGALGRDRAARLSDPTAVSFQDNGRLGSDVNQTVAEADQPRFTSQPGHRTLIDNTDVTDPNRRHLLHRHRGGSRRMP